MSDCADVDPFVALARDAVEEFATAGTTKAVPNPVPPEMQRTTGAFVCVKMHGQLRGCIGTIEPCEPNLAAEIIQNAISAATRDPRFDPITTDDLDALCYSVDVLTEPEPVRSMDDLDPKRYGVIVESGCKRGLLLPDLEGVETVEDQVCIAARKAGIWSDEPMTLYRFEVERHE